MKNLFFLFTLTVFTSFTLWSQVLINAINTPTSLTQSESQNFNIYSQINENIDLKWISILNFANSINSTNGILTFSLPNESPQLQFQHAHSEYENNFNFEWYGERILNDIQSPDYVLFKMMDGMLYGELSIDNSYYRIYPISENKQIFVKLINQEQGSIKSDLGDGGTNYTPERLDTCILNGSSCILDIYFAFTPSLANKMPLVNLLPMIRMMLSQLNVTYIRSKVKHRARIAEIAELKDIGWTDKSRSKLDMDQLKPLVIGPSDLNTKMNITKSDVVVLLTTGSNWPSDEHGIAFKCASPPCTIVKFSSATDKRYTFTHEVGHLLCGGHEDDSGPFSIAYTDSSTFSTVIHQVPAISNRILNYSNPYVKYSGKPTGSPQKFNACVIQNTGCGIANFNEPYRCTLNATGAFDSECSPTKLTVTAIMKPDSCQAKHYDFKYTFDGFTYFTVCAFTTSNICEIPLLGIPNNKSVTVKITAYGNGLNIIGYLFKTFNTICPVTPIPSNLQKKPNVNYSLSDSDLQEQIFLAKELTVVLCDIYTLNGVLIKHFPFNVEKGDNYLNHEVSKLTQGVYIVKIYSQERLLLTKKIIAK